MRGFLRAIAFASLLTCALCAMPPPSGCLAEYDVLEGKGFKDPNAADKIVIAFFWNRAQTCCEFGLMHRMKCGVVAPSADISDCSCCRN